MRVNHIRTFDQLMSRYGQGHGCEICKPLVASVLASCWNEYLLKPAHLPPRTPMIATSPIFRKMAPIPWSRVWRQAK